MMFLFSIGIDLVSPTSPVENVDVDGYRRNDKEQGRDGTKPTNAYLLHGGQYNSSSECTEKVANHVVSS
jgi:hypothetical protein